MEHRPRRSLGLDHADHALCDASHERVVDLGRFWSGLGQHRGEHPSQLGGAEHPLRLDPPGCALLGLAAGLVFRLPGLKSGLLGQGELLQRRRRPLVIVLEPCHQLRGPGGDLVAARRPPADKARVDAGDLVDRSLPVPTGRDE